MQRAFRKLTRDDFHARLRRLDTRNISAGAPDNRAGGLGPILGGFAWMYVVLTVARNRDYLEASLAQGALGPTQQDMVMMGLSCLLGASGVMMALHVMRALLARRGRRGMSGRLVAGAFAACLLIYTPPSVWQTGLGMLDQNSRSLLMTASNSVQDTLPDMALGNVTFVSSAGW